MLFALAIALTAAQAPQPSIEAAVLVEDRRVVVTVRLLPERTIKTIELDPRRNQRSEAAAETPHTQVTLPKDLGVRFTFRPVAEPFDIVVTLDDDTVRRIEKRDWKPHREYAFYRVRAVR